MTKPKSPEPPPPEAAPLYSPAAKQILTGLFVLAFLLAFFLRFYDLERKPLHHDEGVNAWFLLNLKKDFPAGWKYDYQNYHGPFLFFTHIIPLSIKESVFSLRCSVALFGSLLILLLWPLRRKIGRLGVAAAAFLLALSPTNLFFARTNIHETYFAFFTLAAVVAAVRFWESRKAAYVVLAAACAAWVVTNKETYVMTAVAFLLAGGAVLFLNHRRFLAPRGRPGRAQEILPRVFFRELFAWYASHRGAVLAALGAFLLIIVVYFSSLFTNYKGPTIDMVRTLLKWTKTGTEGEGHNKPAVYFANLLLKFELPILLLGVLGAVFAFLRRNAFAIFSVFWSVILFLIYSAVPYKTPWLALSFIAPLALLAGFFCEQLYRSLSGNRALTIGAGVLAAALLVAWARGVSFPVNYEYYDDDRYMLVYSQTRRDLNDMMARIKDYAFQQGQGYDTEIKITSDEYWPMQWYLRDYGHVGFWGPSILEPTSQVDPDSPIIIGRSTTQAKLEAKLKDTYYSEMYSLRPGVDLILYTRLHRGKTAAEQLKGTAPVEVSSAEKKPGLNAKYYRKINPVGEPDLVKTESAIDFRYDKDEEKPMKSPFSILWEGLIEIPAAGNYTFGTVSDDGSWVFIDDKLVVDNGGSHAMDYKSNSIWLEPGFHRIQIKYFDSAWGAVMKLTWIPPGGREGPIPPESLWHQ